MISLISRSFCSSPFSRIGNRVVSQSTRRYPFTIHIRSIPIGFPWIWPLFTYISESDDKHQSTTKSSSTDEEEEIYKELKQFLSKIVDSPKSKEEVCIAYVDKLCRDGNISVTAGLLKLLRNKGILLSAKVYNLILVEASERKDIDLLSEVFEELLVSSESFNKTSYQIVANAFTKIDDNSQLLRFVKEVSELTNPRNTIVLNRIIFAFGDCRHIEKALLIFDQIKSLKLKCKPDLITYNIVLDFLGRAGRIDEMLHEFTSMKEARILPDLISYNTLLNNLRKLGKMDTCLELVKEMTETGLKPDLLTYTALIEIFGRSGKLDECLRLFAEMKQKKIWPSIYVYRSLINTFKKMGKVEWAMNILEEMHSPTTKFAGPQDFKQKDRFVLFKPVRSV